MEVEDGLIVKRTLNTEGKGKIFMNGQQVSVKLLREVGRCLVEVHGQFDNQGLLNPASHRGVLDAYGRYAALLEEVKNRYAEFPVGTTVCHASFGLGKVIAVDGNKLEIIFENAGHKRLMKDYVSKV